MRFSVRRLDVCPGEEKHILRKSALWARTLTEKCTLGADPHGKAHSDYVPYEKVRSVCALGHRMRLYVSGGSQNAPFREKAHAECAFP